jgi:DNA-binding transcriptional ArsR family regulator
LTPRERVVLVELCRPLLSANVFTQPASVREIAEVLVVSEAAVKQHLGRLYEKFGVVDDVAGPRGCSWRREDGPGDFPRCTVRHVGRQRSPDDAELAMERPMIFDPFSPPSTSIWRGNGPRPRSATPRVSATSDGGRVGEARELSSSRTPTSTRPSNVRR